MPNSLIIIVIMVFTPVIIAYAEEPSLTDEPYIYIGQRSNAMSTGEKLLILQSRKIVQQFKYKLGKTLKYSLKSLGPASAIKTCNEIAPKLAKDFSEKFQIQIYRVSLKNRNPIQGKADQWETSRLNDFDEHKALLEKDTFLETSEIVNELDKFYFRYMQALDVKPLCLTCHGEKNYIPAEVHQVLRNIYPNDTAIEYRIGDIRGAVSIKKMMH